VSAPANWLREQINSAREEIARWPAWKKEELAAETRAGAEGSSDKSDLTTGRAADRALSGEASR
jgi:hypothetical protein